MVSWRKWGVPLAQDAVDDQTKASPAVEPL